MKKLTSLILALMMCITLCACDEKSKPIELTLENYEDYLDFDLDNTFKDLVYWDCYDDKRDRYSCYLNAFSCMEISGTSSNYDYCDVEVTVLVEATYKTFNRDNDEVKDCEFSKEFTIKCDIGGSGETERFVIFETERDERFGDVMTAIIRETFECKYKVVSIKGAVERVS